MFLKDAPSETLPSVEACDNPGNADDYGANDLFLANTANTKTLWVCSGDDDLSGKICPPQSELILVLAEMGACIPQPGEARDLAVAIYFRRE